MKYSYNWLKEYVENIPDAKEIASRVTMHSFEVEEVVKTDNDTVLDIKILPNRSHDCLSHYGMAREISALFDVKTTPLLPSASLTQSDKFQLKVLTDACRRGLMIYIEDVTIGESPDWMKNFLIAIGQRPINSAVDVTNFLMYAFGQPMHAFDADTLKKNDKGNLEISIRNAKAGEKIKLLTGNEYELDESVAVISDCQVALDVAGIMGGDSSGVSLGTKNIILSISSFDAVSIRKTSTKLRVKTDASTRFENDISVSLVDRVLPYAVKYFTEICNGHNLSIIDINKDSQKQKTIKFDVKKISYVLGKEIADSEIIELLSKQNIVCEIKDGEIIVTPPMERLDINIPEDVVEEVGRMYGYENILSTPLNVSVNPEVNKIHYVSNEIRYTLYNLGFSEIYSYSLVNQGDIELENPMAGDKNFLRNTLLTEMSNSLANNLKYVDLLILKSVKLFEIGKVFKKDGEYLYLSIGVKNTKQIKRNPDEMVAEAISKVEERLGISFGEISIVGGMAEINLEKIMTEVLVPEKYPDDVWGLLSDKVIYKPYSRYPFAVRDVAVFVPNSVSDDEVQNTISANFTDIVVKSYLFDKFTKGDKTSYAYRIIFQSQSKTLTDTEINEVMEAVYVALKSREGFEIR